MHLYSEMKIRFHSASPRGGAEGMAGCYHSGVPSFDLGFPDLACTGAGSRREMSCRRWRDFVSESGDVEAAERCEGLGERKRARTTIAQGLHRTPASWTER